MNKNVCWKQLPGRCLPLRTLSLLIAGVCAALSGAQAQPSPNATTLALQSVVVSGARNEQRRDDLPLSMDVLSAADLEAGQIGDIRDMARSLPNVAVKRAPARFTVTGAGNSTGRDGNAGFNVRGQDGNRVLMLIDGVRLPRSYINGNNAFGRDVLSLDLLKRVELVRGPSSVLYGSDALAGMVNFITHEPADFLTSVDGRSKGMGGKLGLSYSGDDAGLSAAATLAAAASESAQWLLTATARRARGLDNLGSNDVANLDRTTPNPQTDRNASVLGKLVLQPGAGQKHVLTLEHVRQDTDVDLLSSHAKAPLGASSVVDESASKTMLRERLTWQARYTVAGVLADRVQTLLSLQNTVAQDNGRTTRNDGGVRVRDTAYGERAWQASVQADKTLVMSPQWVQKLSYGLDYSHTRITSLFDGFDPAPLVTYVPKKYFPDTRDASVALYAQSEWVSERLSITPGLRLEQFSLTVIRQDGFSPPSPTPGISVSGSSVTPKLGALYRVAPQWSVYGNYASGFRAPNAAQVNGFVENPTPSTFVKLLANPDLQPETSKNLELGARARLDRVNLDLAAFVGDFHQLIIDKKPLGGTGVAGNPLLFQSVNIDNARIWGFEAKGVLDLGDLGGATLSLPFSYGQTRGWDRASGLPLNSINPAKLALGLKWATPQWDLALDATQHAAKTVDELDSPYLPKPATPPRVAQFTVPAASTLDLHGQWRVRKNLRANFSVVNLTNRKYWLWSDVQGLAATSAVIDAYTQPGRHLNLSLVLDL
jgi:hemoglobin/transferrin/lactoferrin receptor protein